MIQPIKYYGSKWSVAPWIIRHFPPHKSYIEPLGGSAAVLLNKPRSELETYNDIDGAVVNYFRMIRDEPFELSRVLRATPWARAEFEFAVDTFEASNDPIERARRFAVASFMSVSQRWREMENPGVRMLKNADGRYSKPAFDLERVAAGLNEIAERLTGVQIENRDWFNVAIEYANNDSLIYFDPPYPLETRGDRRGYAFEWDGDDHWNAVSLLQQIPGFVVVSGYRCDLYDRLYADWPRFDSEPVLTNSGGSRVESIWLSPYTADALAADFGPLFRSR